MKKFSYALLAGSVVWAAGLPHEFQTGGPARASEVNENFKYLDTTKASRTSVDSLKATLSSIPTSANLGTKVDTADLTKRLNALPTVSVAGKADQSWVRDSLKNLASKDTLKNFAQTSALAAYAKTADLGVYAKTVDLGTFSKSTDLANGLATKADLTWARDTLKNFPRLSGKNMLLTDSSYISGAGIFLPKKNTLPLSIGYPYKPDNSTYPPVGWQIYQMGGNDQTLNLSYYPGGPNGNRGLVIHADGSADIDRDLYVSGVSGGGELSITDSAIIGTNLHVGGKIFASTSAITVPDYVFESGYRLMPLSEVESFTQREKHLPEIPSAAEIGKGGLDLTEMNLALLKKVEELTLHAIEQAKQIDSQKADISVLQACNASQEERIKALEDRLGAIR